MEKLNSIISNNLVYMRKKLGLKQSDIAKKLNYSDKMVSKWENGDIVPSVENLCALADIYGVTLDDMVKTKIEDNDTIELKNQKWQRNNKIVISLLAVSVVWILATIIFVNLNLAGNVYAWLTFLWAVPISCVVGLIFNSLWGRPFVNYIIITIFIWTLITCFYLQFLQFNLVPLYFLGIPAQVSVILWSKLKMKALKNKKSKIKNEVKEDEKS